MNASGSRTRRLTTVHDVATLRVHPDGSRVPSNPRPAVSATRLNPRQARYTTRDARGNWIARDAAGLGMVKKLITVETDSGEGEEEDSAIARPEKGKKGIDDADILDEEGTKKPEGYRARKRRRFESDWDFLRGEDSRDASRTEASSSTSILPTPSSDLLKCIHHFTSSYYASKGQLYNASHDYRARRKERQRKKIKGKKLKSGSSDEEHIEGGNSEDEEDEDEDEDDEGTDEYEGDEDADEDAAVFKRRKRRFRPKEELKRDMYKLFDGSALMALGILLQEHVAELVEDRIPADWQPVKPDEEATDDDVAGDGEGQSDAGSEAGPQNEGSDSDDGTAEGS